MQRAIALSLAILFCLTAVVQAEPTIVIGNYNLQPNLAGQLIPITVTGIAPNTVNGVTFAMSIDNGGPAFGGSLGPIITGIDIDSGPTIWASPNAAGHNPPNFGQAPPDQLVAIYFLTTSGFVNVASGLVMTLIVDTTGFGPGVHSFSLTTGSAIEDNFGPSDFTGQNFVSSIQGDGLIIMPEPSSVALGLFAVAGFGVVAIRKRPAHRM
jgi:hypothetical protein